MILGFCYPVVFVIAPDRLSAFASLTAPWWSWVASFVIVAISVTLVGVSVRRRPDLLSAVGYGSAAAYTAVILAWFAGWNGETVPAVTGTGLELWVVFIPQVVAGVLILVARVRAALATLLVTGGLSLALTVAASGQGEWIGVVQAAWLLTLASLYQVIAWALMAGARRFDEERTAAAAEAVRRLHHDAHEAEQRRLDAMVHDRLIALLLALRPGPLSPAGANAITGVLDEIAEWRVDGVAAPSHVPATDLVQRLRLSVDEIDDDVHIAAEVDGEADYPAEAVDAIIDAVGEAVRNFRRHAGSDAGCAVLVDARTAAISAVVVDDGIGFDVHDVPANRIGVELGIIERMNVLDGGRCRVESEPGVGTRVELSWATPDGDR